MERAVQAQVHEEYLRSRDGHGFKSESSTFIELCFQYEGLPESKNSTRFKEDAAMDDAEDVEAEGMYILESVLSVRQQCWVT